MTISTNLSKRPYAEISLPDKTPSLLGKRNHAAITPPANPLLEDGFHVLQAAVKVPPGLLEETIKAATKVIFKKQPTTFNAKKINKIIKEFLEKANKIVSTRLTGRLSSWTIFDSNNTIQSFTANSKSISVVVSLMPGTRLYLCPANPLHFTKMIELEIGDILIFHGDRFHVENKLEEDNYHLHAYLTQ